MSAIVTIAASASLSDALVAADFGGVPIGIVMPADWTAASLTFQASDDGGSYANLYDQFGNEVTVAASTSRYIALPPDIFVGVRYLKVRSGTAASPVAQSGADRALTIVLRR